MTLSRVDYWRLSSLLPIVVPAFVVPISVAAPLLGVRLPPWVENGIMVAFMGAFMFGLLYVPVAAAVLLLLRRSSWRSHAAAAVVLPVVMVVCFGAATPVLTPDATPSEFMAFWAPYCLGLGYFYVALAFGGMWLVERAGGFQHAA